MESSRRIRRHFGKAVARNDASKKLLAGNAAHALDFELFVSEIEEQRFGLRIVLSKGSEPSKV